MRNENGYREKPEEKEPDYTDAEVFNAAYKAANRSVGGGGEISSDKVMDGLVKFAAKQGLKKVVTSVPGTAWLALDWMNKADEFAQDFMTAKELVETAAERAVHRAQYEKDDIESLFSRDTEAMKTALKGRTLAVTGKERDDYDRELAELEKLTGFSRLPEEHRRILKRMIIRRIMKASQPEEE